MAGLPAYSLAGPGQISGTLPLPVDWGAEFDLVGTPYTHIPGLSLGKYLFQRKGSVSEKWSPQVVSEAEPRDQALQGPMCLSPLDPLSTAACVSSTGHAHLYPG